MAEALSVDDVAAFIVRSQHSVDRMKLQKLLYYAQSWHLAVFDRPLFDETFEAWGGGPVINSVYQASKAKPTYDITSWDGDPEAVSGQAAALLRAVMAEYASQSAGKLSSRTHNEEPWLVARHGLPDGARSRSKIAAQSMAEFTRRSCTLGGQYAADIAAGGVIGGDFAPDVDDTEPLHDPYARDVVSTLEVGHADVMRRPRRVVPTSVG
ncbi:DUF4065 domain-containing protein [Demequina capsici]|uniref:DUF4065 domain-containing protein n=1 Tax=Demequina capsici TaxID=3075620 RepID=A0AA96FC26_9MICO|nr:type II toxin-antitoxin system antitoxin SocA domain-containing protein [Demequina sp. PMTSA13]WNM27564.1 DUF4065 domain-containing protein [Demequina sp. PMTSA13]